MLEHGGAPRVVGRTEWDLSVAALPTGEPLGPEPLVMRVGGGTRGQSDRGLGLGPVPRPLATCSPAANMAARTCVEFV
jgi:hypothetical protein